MEPLSWRCSSVKYDSSRSLISVAFLLTSTPEELPLK